MSMPSQATAWRQLTDAEYAAMPEAQPGGPLGLIFALTAALALVTAIPAGLFLISVVQAVGLSTLYSGILANNFGTGPAAIARTFSGIQQLAMCVWAAAFVLMTLTRSPAAPRIAPALLAIWAAIAIVSNVSLRVMLQRSGINIESLLQVVPFSVFELVVAAVFWGYMQDGRQPNIYFRRRVRT